MATYNRKPNTKVKYSSPKTKAYKSAWQRWRKAGSLAPTGMTRSGNLTILLFASSRAPDGFWRVTVTFGDGGDGGGGNGTPNPPCWQPAPPLPGDSVAINYVRWFPWRGQIDDLGSGTYGTANNRPNWQAGPSPSPYPNGSVQAVPGVEIYLDWQISKYYVQTGATYTNEIGADSAQFAFVETWYSTYIWPNVPVFPPEYDPAPPLSPYDQSTSGATYYRVCPTPSPSPSPTPTPSPGGSGKPTVGPCTCPDKTKQVGSNPRSTFTSEKRDRNWTQSKAGSAGLCKHQFAARNYLGLETVEPRPDTPAAYQQWLKTRAQVRRQKRAKQNRQKRGMSPDVARLIAGNSPQISLAEGRARRQLEKAEIKVLKDSWRNQRIERSRQIKARIAKGKEIRARIKSKANARAAAQKRAAEFAKEGSDPTNGGNSF
jgi:hypothetical protein